MENLSTDGERPQLMKTRTRSGRVATMQKIERRAPSPRKKKPPRPRLRCKCSVMVPAPRVCVVALVVAILPLRACVEVGNRVCSSGPLRLCGTLSRCAVRGSCGGGDGGIGGQPPRASPPATHGGEQTQDAGNGSRQL